MAWVKRKGYRVATDQIFYGGEWDLSRPAVVDAARVYRRLPDYQPIAEGDLTAEDATYWIRLARATGVFQRAVTQVARRRKYSIVVNRGGLEVVPEEGGRKPVDCTRAVMAMLPR